VVRVFLKLGQTYLWGFGLLRLLDEAGSFLSSNLETDWWVAGKFDLNWVVFIDFGG
jgi:hypothetical protein